MVIKSNRRSKSIELQTPRPSAKELSDYIQATHQASFESDASSTWNVEGRRDSHLGSMHRSALDMYDREASYRVLSLVLCDDRQAIEVTLHDYFCEDYEATKADFDIIEQSIGLVSGAA